MVPRCISIMGLALSLFLLSVRVEGTERRKIVLAQGVDTVTAEDLLSGGPCFGTGCRREVLGALASIPYGVPLEGCLITSNAASDASTATMEVVHNCQDRNGNPSQQGVGDCDYTVCASLEWSNFSDLQYEVTVTHSGQAGPHSVSVEVILNYNYFGGDEAITSNLLEATRPAVSADNYAKGLLCPRQDGCSLPTPCGEGTAKVEIYAWDRFGDGWVGELSGQANWWFLTSNDNGGALVMEGTVGPYHMLNRTTLCLPHGTYSFGTTANVEWLDQPYVGLYYEDECLGWRGDFLTGCRGRRTSPEIIPGVQSCRLCFVDREGWEQANPGMRIPDWVDCPCCTAEALGLECVHPGNNIYTAAADGDNNSALRGSILFWSLVCLVGLGFCISAVCFSRIILVRRRLSRRFGRVTMAQDEDFPGDTTDSNSGMMMTRATGSNKHHWGRGTKEAVQGGTITTSQSHEQRPVDVGASLVAVSVEVNKHDKLEKGELEPIEGTQKDSTKTLIASTLNSVHSGEYTDFTPSSSVVPTEWRKTASNPNRHRNDRNDGKTHQPEKQRDPRHSAKKREKREKVPSILAVCRPGAASRGSGFPRGRPKHPVRGRSRERVEASCSSSSYSLSPRKSRGSRSRSRSRRRSLRGSGSRSSWVSSSPSSSSSPLSSSPSPSSSSEQDMRRRSRRGSRRSRRHQTRQKKQMKSSASWASTPDRVRRLIRCASKELLSGRGVRVAASRSAATAVAPRQSRKCRTHEREGGTSRGTTRPGKSIKESSAGRVVRRPKTHNPGLVTDSHRNPVHNNQKQKNVSRSRGCSRPRSKSLTRPQSLSQRKNGGGEEKRERRGKSRYATGSAPNGKGEGHRLDPPSRYPSLPIFSDSPRPPQPVHESESGGEEERASRPEGFCSGDRAAHLKKENVASAIVRSKEASSKAKGELKDGRVGDRGREGYKENALLEEGSRNDGTTDMEMTRDSQKLREKQVSWRKVQGTSAGMRDADLPRNKGESPLRARHRSTLESRTLRTKEAEAKVRSRSLEAGRRSTNEGKDASFPDLGDDKETARESDSPLPRSRSMPRIPPDRIKDDRKSKGSAPGRGVSPAEFYGFIEPRTSEERKNSREGTSAGSTKGRKGDSSHSASRTRANTKTSGRSAHTTGGKKPSQSGHRKPTPEPEMVRAAHEAWAEKAEVGQGGKPMFDLRRSVNKARVTNDLPSVRVVDQVRMWNARIPEDPSSISQLRASTECSRAPFHAAGCKGTSSRNSPAAQDRDGAHRSKAKAAVALSALYPAEDSMDNMPFSQKNSLYSQQRPHHHKVKLKLKAKSPGSSSGWGAARGARWKTLSRSHSTKSLPRRASNLETVAEERDDEISPMNQRPVSLGLVIGASCSSTHTNALRDSGKGGGCDRSSPSQHTVPHKPAKCVHADRGSSREGGLPEEPPVGREERGDTQDRDEKAGTDFFPTTTAEANLL